jgi:acetyl-CoA synthetase
MIRCSSSTPRGPPANPKGVVHATGGYLLHVALTHKLIFNIHDDDMYWCTADIGWVTGHSYIVYGPLANGATSPHVRRRADLPGRRSVLADL